MFKENSSWWNYQSEEHEDEVYRPKLRTRPRASQFITTNIVEDVKAKNAEANDSKVNDIANDIKVDDILVEW